MEMSHREQKKIETRQALIQGALELFAGKGFDATTIADIAASANCAPRTFFLYFDSKEALMPAAAEQAADGLAQALASRSRNTTTLDVFRIWMTQMFEHHPGGARRQAAHQYPSFQTRKDFFLARTLEPILATAFAKDLDVKPDATEPKLLASSAVAALGTFNINNDKKYRAEFVDTTILLLETSLNAFRNPAGSSSHNNPKENT